MLFIAKENLFFFDANKLHETATSLRDSYVKGDPFPHIVIDNFLPHEVAEKILLEFPKSNEINWRNQFHANSRKLGCNQEDQMGSFTRHMISRFNSAIFLNFLEKVTGIEGLIPDPLLQGGGLHQIKRGGFLKIHSDFNYHTKWRLDRRLNLLLYLNKNWREEYGGHLELWNKSMSTCVKKILPIFNRCVIFSTTDYSYHGHPDALKCPEEETRKSLALYYYSNGRPSHERSEEHSTLYQSRPQERKLKYFAKLLTPPILWDFMQKMKVKG